VNRAEPYGFDGSGNAAVAGQHHDAGRRIFGEQHADHLQARFIADAQVDHCVLRRLLAEPIGFGRAGRALSEKTAISEGSNEPFA
jgi:hypothetical protein